MIVRVSNTLDDLAADTRKVAGQIKPKAASLVKRKVAMGRQVARRFAQESSGPHGVSYYKRITSEMTGTLEGEFGPTGDVVGRAVGAGWRHGENTDLPRAGDIVVPTFGNEAGDMLADLFWPA